MEETKGEHSVHVVSEVEPVSAKELPKKAKRVASLDIFRGLTVAVHLPLLILCKFHKLASFVYYHI